MKNSKTQDQKKIRLPQKMPILEQCMVLILEKDFQLKSALAALEAMRKECVDWNELRVSSIPQIADMLTPLSKDSNRILKTQILKEFTNQVFNLRHSLNMEFLREESKEKQLKFLTSLEILEPYMIKTLMQNL